EQPRLPDLLEHRIDADGGGHPVFRGVLDYDPGVLGHGHHELQVDRFDTLVDAVDRVFRRAVRREPGAILSMLGGRHVRRIGWPERALRAVHPGWLGDLAL